MLNSLNFTAIAVTSFTQRNLSLDLDKLNQICIVITLL